MKATALRELRKYPLDQSLGTKMTNQPANQFISHGSER